MLGLRIIAMLLMILGGFLVMGIKWKDVVEVISKWTIPQAPSLKLKIVNSTNPQKPKGLKRILTETREMLEITHRAKSFSFICILSVSLFVGGIVLAAILDNMFLIPVLAAGVAMLPFSYVKLLSIVWQKQLNAELETALSIVTTSYMRSENIISAFEENLPYINPPVADVFKGFTSHTRLINSNIKLALENLKGSINQSVFQEWCDGMIACQEDKNLKNTLPPIVSKLSDMRVVGAELDYLLYEPMKEFITMAILLVGNIPLMYFLNREWFRALFFSMPGKIVLAGCGAVLFISMVAVVGLTKPIEYKR